jgi:anti-sigma factor RsiW
MTNDLFDHQSSDGDHEDRHLSLEILSAYLDAELTADERGVVTTHLSTCQRCQSELQSLRATTTLMRSLPEMRPAKSFQLGPEYAKNARGAVGSRWLARMLRLMPALRAATAAVAMLLVVVVAGDVLTNQENGNQERPAVTTNVTSTAANQYTAPTSTSADSLMMESEAPSTSSGEADNAAPAAGAAAPNEAAKEESATQENSEASAMQAQEDGAADESRAAESEQTSSPALQPAAAAPTVTVEPSPTSEPTASPQPTATPGPSEASGTSEGRTSNWRIAEIALGLLLAWLIVTLVGLRRLRHD